MNYQTLRKIYKNIKIMKIMILGSEGYMGWPTSLNQCSQGRNINDR